MGGRGANYKIVGRLKNFKKARIFKSKLYDYVLEPDNPKAKALYAVGYDRQHYKLLENDIRKNLESNKALKYNNNKQGDKVYQVNMSLGITQKRIFTTAWVIKKGHKSPTLVSIYPNKTPYFKKGTKQ